MFADARPILALVGMTPQDASDVRTRVGALVRVCDAADFSALQQPARFGHFTSSDGLAIDCRRATSLQHEVVRRFVTCRREPYRLLVVESHAPCGEDGPRGTVLSHGVGLAAAEPAAPLVAALHNGLGRHDVLITAMRSLSTPLTPVGRQVVSEVLSSRFACRTVHDVAARCGVHRTRLHHRLVEAGDPAPKLLLDACYSLVCALLMQDPTLRTSALMHFLRARYLRTPRDAVQRTVGMSLAELRQQALRRSSSSLQQLVTARMLEEAERRNDGLLAWSA